MKDKCMPMLQLKCLRNKKDTLEMDSITLGCLLTLKEDDTGHEVTVVLDEEKLRVVKFWVDMRLDAHNPDANVASGNILVDI